MNARAVKSLVFGDANIKREYVHKVIIDYHTFWSGWFNLASYPAELDDYVRIVGDMPINIPWREPGKYGDGLDYLSILNKALYLRNLDPEVLRYWSESASDDSVFKDLSTGYDEEEIRNIKCPVLLIQANWTRAVS